MRDLDPPSDTEGETRLTLPLSLDAASRQLLKTVCTAWRYRLGRVGRPDVAGMFRDLRDLDASGHVVIGLEPAAVRMVARVTLRSLEAATEEPPAPDVALLRRVMGAIVDATQDA